MNTHTSGIRRHILAAMLVALVAGCAGSRTQESTGEYIDDSTITTKVKTVMLKDPAVSGLAINVETFKGTVQLSGFARTEQERARAIELAQSVAGVKSVRNDIAIR